jgi:hypothetical protein
MAVRIFKKNGSLSPKEKQPFIPKYYLIFVFYNKYRENKLEQRAEGKIY